MKLKKIILKVLLDSPFSIIFADCIKNQKILDILSESNDWVVKSSVACNKWVSTKTLIKLATDSDWFIRYSAIENPKATEEVLLAYKSYLWYRKFNNSFCFEDIM